MRKVLAFLVLTSAALTGCKKSEPAPAPQPPPPAPVVQAPAVPAPQAPTTTEDPAQPGPQTLKMRDEIENLGKVAEHTPAIEARLVQALRHHDQDVRGHACWALGRMAPKTKAAIPQLVQALSDPVWAVEHNAAWALVRFGPDAREPLQAALKDDDVRRRVRAGKALLELAPDLSATVEPVLLGAKQAQDLQTQSVVLEALGLLQPPSEAAVDHLIAALTSQLTATALPSLARLGPAAAKAVPAVAKVTENTDKELRLAAAVALGEIGKATPEALAALVKLLDDEKEHVSANAAGALSRLQALDVLETTLASPSLRVRQNAVRALAGTEALDDKRVKLLVKAMADADWQVRLAAIGAFQGRKEPVAQAAVPAIAKALKDENEVVRSQAKASLEQMGSDAAKKALQRRGV